MTAEYMMMKNLKDHLEENALFEKVLILKKGPATSDLFREIPDLTGFPACVIAGSDVRTLNGGVTGDCETHVVVICPFYAGSDPEFERGLEILHQTILLLQCDGQGKVLHIGEYHYIFEQVEELSLSGELLAWKIRLNVKYSPA